MILSHKEIEEIAAAVTKDFNEFFFGPDTDGRRLPRGTPIDQFAREYLGLNVSFAYLSEDGSICGLTAYTDTEYIVEDRGFQRKIPLHRNEVLMDRNFIEPSQIRKLCGKRRFTLAHECAHQILFQMDDCAVQFDADGQHRPEYIAAMIRKIEEGNDIVIASRFVEEKKPTTARMIGSRLITTAIRLTSGAKIMDPTSGMRMYNKKLIEVLANNINFGPEPDTVSYLIKMGAKVAEIQAKMDERIAGQSYLNAVNAAKYMARMLISILLIQNFRNKKKVDFTK